MMDVLILDCGDSIKGELFLTGYIDKTEVLSYSHGVSQHITGVHTNQKCTSSGPNHQSFIIRKKLDLSTPSLIDYCDQGKPIPSVVLTIEQEINGAVTAYMTYTSPTR